MQLTVDGKTVEAKKGQSLRELVCGLGLDQLTLLLLSYCFF